MKCDFTEATAQNDQPAWIQEKQTQVLNLMIFK